MTSDQLCTFVYTTTCYFISISFLLIHIITSWNELILHSGAMLLFLCHWAVKIRCVRAASSNSS